MMELKIKSHQLNNYEEIVESIKIPPMHTVTYKTEILKNNKIKIDEKKCFMSMLNTSLSHFPL